MINYVFKCDSAICTCKSAKKKKKNKSTEKVIEMNKPMNNLTNDLEDC